VLFGYSHEVEGGKLDAIAETCSSMGVDVDITTISKDARGTVLLHDTVGAQARDGSHVGSKLDIERERTKQLELQLDMREVVYSEKLLDYSVKVMEHKYRMALLDAPEAKRLKTGVSVATQYHGMCGDDRPPLQWLIEEHCEQSPHLRGPIRRFLEDFKVAT
jgi:hypothetical protein